MIKKIFENFIHAHTGFENILIDTADTYGPDPTNDVRYIEHIIGEILLKNHSINVCLATKCGMARISPNSDGWRPLPGTIWNRDYVKEQVRLSRLAFGGFAACAKNQLIMQFHHVDQVMKSGKLIECLDAVNEIENTSVGLCNVSTKIFDYVETHERAGMLFSIQNEYNFWSKTSERLIIPKCVEYDIMFIAHSPFGGLKTRRGERDIVVSFPRLVPLALKMNITPHRLYLAYLIVRLERMGLKRIVIIPGGRDPEHVEDSLQAARHVAELTDQDIQELDRGWDKEVAT